MPTPMLMRSCTAANREPNKRGSANAAAGSGVRGGVCGGLASGRVHERADLLERRLLLLLALHLFAPLLLVALVRDVGLFRVLKQVDAAGGGGGRVHRNLQGPVNLMINYTASRMAG